MNPLTVTWSPHLYTIGWQNFQNWINSGFDNYLFTPNPKVHRRLTREATIRLLHPFQPFIIGQKTFAVKMAAKFNVSLIFYGELGAKTGRKISHKIKNFTEIKNQKGFQIDPLEGKKFEDCFIGKKVSEYIDEGKV